MKLIILCTLLISNSLLAQSGAQEEAIILNQEMQFLQESAKNVTALKPRPLGEEDQIVSETPQARDLNLERTYFGEEELDSVRTRTAAPKRRATED